MKPTETVKTVDFKELRKQAGLTLKALAEKSNYSVAAINGLENNHAGSKRLRTRVFEVLTSEIQGVPLRAAAALADKTGGTEKEKQATFEATAERLSAAAWEAKSAQRKLVRLRAQLTEMLALIDSSDDLPRISKRTKSKATKK